MIGSACTFDQLVVAVESRVGVLTIAGSIELWPLVGEDE